jgi:hypothetical protein
MRLALLRTTARPAPRRAPTCEVEVMTVLWIILAIIWVALFIFLGISTLRRGHWVMFIIGIFIPLFWIIGALIPPTEEAIIEEI